MKKELFALLLGSIWMFSGHGELAAQSASKPPARLPMAGAECFVSKDDDGRVFQLRMTMMDEKKVFGDLLVINVQTGEWAQGRLNGERREGGWYGLTWGFSGEDKIRHLINQTYFREDDKLTQRSKDKQDDGRVFKKTDCANFK